MRYWLSVLVMMLNLSCSEPPTPPRPTNHVPPIHLADQLPHLFDPLHQEVYQPEDPTDTAWLGDQYRRIARLKPTGAALRTDNFPNGKMVRFDRYLYHQFQPWNEYGSVQEFYRFEQGAFRRQWSRRFQSVTLEGDSIFDVNQDGQFDLVSHLHSQAGCCRRRVHEWYFPTSRNGALGQTVRCLNPQYDPANGAVRGVYYGHPGEVSLYEYQWRGYALELLEEIHPLEEFPFRFLRRRPDATAGYRTEWLTELPDEYRELPDLDWFLLYLNRLN